MTTSTENKAYQSKWGFHPCDKETYMKLKKLNYWFLEAQREASEWNRWSRKDKQNRVIRKFVRNDKGQKIGVEIIGPKPEPSLNSIFCKIDKETSCYYMRYDWTRTAQTYWLRRIKFGESTKEEYCFYLTGLYVNSFGIDSDYQNAKRPTTEKNVQPLKNSVEQIDDLYEKVLEWQNSLK